MRRPGRVFLPRVNLRSGSPWRRIGGMVAIVAVCLAWRLGTGGSKATAQAPAHPSRPAAAPAASSPAPASAAATAKPAGKPAIAALVNGTAIGWEQLSMETLARHGAATLDTLVNRRIIEQACAKQGVEVSPAEVAAEIDAMSRRFGVPRDKFVELIHQERGVTEKQYSNEIVWPMLALRKLARGTVQPKEEEIVAAFESRFGPAVKARIIVARTAEEAGKLRALAAASPAEFGAIARRSSTDVGTASANGWVQPIRRHTGDEGFEATAFALEEGEISKVVQVGDQFIILKCEGHLPASDVKLEDVRPKIVEELGEQASRTASANVFRALEQAAKVERRLDASHPTATPPAVAATVNGEAIQTSQVADIAMDRHGGEVLEILITKALINQALARQKQVVEEGDVAKEIERAARSLGFVKADGTVDTQAWLDRVTKEDGVPMRHYIDDVVRPTVALKKLVGTVTITPDDVQKAFEATFGPRARCRMIVLDTQRRAQEVWQLARQNPTPDFIGELAEKYSADPTSRALRGEVPPIQRYSGQPALEREAFSLKPGEVSGIIQIADRFMILYLEGFTEPMRVAMEEVQGELRDDIHEKKQRIEMSRYFTYLREGAAIDNFLAGTSQTPPRPTNQPPAGMPSSTLSQQETAELARPRAGSRTATPPAQPRQAAGGVAPASLTAPAGR